MSEVRERTAGETTVAGPAPAPAPRALPGGVAPPAPARWEVPAYLVLLGIALAMRLWDLGSRAFHHDESLHALYSWYLAVGRGYQHDPMMHGPFQFHANALLFFLFGASDFTARLLYALFGTALVGLPWLLRGRLGREGAFATAVLLAFSPTLLYYSRFARNDILMAVWTLGLAASLWRYLDERRERWLYLTALLLALSFATKETAYFHFLILAGFLALLAREDLTAWLWGRRRLALFSGAGTLLLLYVSLGLPQWAGALALVQRPLGLTLANLDPAKGPVGLPLDPAGMRVAWAAIGLLAALAAALGLFWDRRRWPRLALTFWGMWTLLYTTAFTRPFGLFTGLWQGLGYWYAQQGVQRGGQPWYYYGVLLSVYEFLPLLVGVPAALYFALRGNPFQRFLAWWLFSALLLYTWAGEKMPWLGVNLALPLCLLAGHTLGLWVRRVRWRAVARSGAWLAWAAVPLFFLLLVRALFPPGLPQGVPGFVGMWALLAGVLGLPLLALAWAGPSGHRWAFLGLGVAGFLFLLTVRAGWLASYRNGDVPVEMLVYTQTSPHLAQLARQVEELAFRSGKGKELRILVDSTDGFSWPWAWYLRDYRRVGYPCFGPDPGCTRPTAAPEADVLLINARNLDWARRTLGEDYVEGIRYPHRWWFPEPYRGLTLRKIWEGLRDRDAWRRALDYWLYRRFDSHPDPRDSLGSVDGVVFYRKDLVAGP